MVCKTNCRVSKDDHCSFGVHQSQPRALPSPYLIGNWTPRGASLTSPWGNHYPSPLLWFLDTSLIPIPLVAVQCWTQSSNRCAAMWRPRATRQPGSASSLVCSPNLDNRPFSLPCIECHSRTFATNARGGKLLPFTPIICPPTPFCPPLRTAEKMLDVISKGGIHLKCTGGECVHVCVNPNPTTSC